MRHWDVEGAEGGGRGGGGGGGGGAESRARSGEGAMAKMPGQNPPGSAPGEAL